MQPFIPPQAKHDVLVTGNHDELMRQEFCKSLRQFVQDDLLSGLNPVFEGSASRNFEKNNGRKPVDRHDIREAMIAEPYFQTYATANRVSMELLWDAVIDPLERDLAKLNSKARELSQGATAPLEVSDDFVVPRYVKAIDIHCMPGGYDLAMCKDDIAAGALYDRGTHVFAMGRMGPDNDDMGRSVCNYLKNNLKDFKPKTVLDMGCTVGHSTLPYKVAFPDIELTGIDVSAPCLRYAHARSASKNLDVGFLQRNAETTGFADESFDLIVSHILLHETSAKAMPAIFKECFRLLKPGGYMIHADLPAFDKMGPFMQFMLDNETHYSNEPFWTAMRQIDQEELAIKAGFRKEDVFLDSAPMAALADMAKPDEEAEEQEFVAGEFAPGGCWEVLVGRKR